MIRAGLSEAPTTGVDTAVEAKAPVPSAPRNWALRKAVQLFPALAYRDYLLFWQGNTGSQIGFWMEQTVQGWLVYELTGSPLYLSLVGLCRNAPMIVVSPIGGVMADRFDRRNILTAAQTVTVMIAVILSALYFSGRLQAWHLLLAAVIAGVAQSTNYPARQALMVSLVAKPHMASAVGLHSTTLGASRVVGPQIAGILLAAVGPAVTYLVQAAAYLWAIVNVLRIKRPPPPAGARSFSFYKNLTAGIRFVSSHPALRAVLILEALVSILVWSYMLFLPAMAKDVLRVGAEGLGLLMAAGGAGALVGSFGAAVTSGYRRKGMLLLASYFLMALTVFLFSVSDELVLSLVLLAGAGFGSGVGVALGSSVLQILVPDEYRGRLTSLQMLVWGLLPLGTLPMGFLASAYGTPFAVGAASMLGMVAVAGVAAFMPVVRRLEC